MASNIYENDADESRIEEILINYIMQNEYQKIEEYLKQNQNLDISQIDDGKGYTLLHRAVLNNELSIVRLLIQHSENFFKQSKPTQSEVAWNIKQWIAQPTKSDEGFTCLHFATFKGLIPIIEYLIQKGADMHQKNKHGLSVLHIASQGNQAISLVYFISKGVNQETVDNKQGTALHWACFLGHEDSVNYLASIKGVNFNKQDIEGLTPLHLATVSGNSRVVRKLLMKGASLEIRDKNGKRPIEIAQDNQYNNIEQMLTKAGFFSQCYNIRPTFQPVLFQRMQLYAFLFFYIIGNFTYIFFNFPYLSDDYLWQLIVFIIISFVVLSSFIFSWLRDPGTLLNEDKTPQMLINLYRYNDIKLVCPECFIIKVTRSRHCELCKKCVSVYDHHCPWINNCVGTRNHAFFLIFIASMWVNLLVVIVFSLLHIYKKYNSINEEHFHWFKGIEGSNTLFIIKIVGTSLLVILSLFFFVPLTMLVWVQINNFFFNQTTYERFSNKNAQNLPTSSIEGSTAQVEMQHLNNQNEFQNNLLPNKKKRNLANCVQMCYSNSQNPEYFNQYQLRQKSSQQLTNSVTISSNSEN